ncbi:COMM domain-containing protein 7-like isoform X1 [Lycorma delicatula]|uniref:COMM domain-containing protein 7-like isoform X1 n=1 Tax=Lycorma delicatula TaxID=130591 RepID=UPI003F510C98
MTNTVTDVDWQFGVTAACSNKNQVGKTYLYLKITSVDSSGLSKITCMEMTLPQFYDFLHELEKAKNSINYL